MRGAGGSGWSAQSEWCPSPLQREGGHDDVGAGWFCTWGCGRLSEFHPA